MAVLLVAIALLLAPLISAQLGPDRRACDPECALLLLERSFLVGELDSAIARGDAASARGWRAAIQDLDRGFWRLNRKERSAGRIGPEPA